MLLDFASQQCEAVTSINSKNSSRNELDDPKNGQEELKKQPIYFNLRSFLNKIYRLF